MKDLLVIAGIVMICFAVGCSVENKVAQQNSVKNQVSQQNSIRVPDVPEVFRQLRQKGADGSFAVFMFSDNAKLESENTINLQFSIENGKIGLDWVLLAPVNIRDERRILDFLESRGAKPRRLTQNEVTYLRAESGDLVVICQDIMRNLYGIKNDDNVDFLSEGFEWKP